MLSSSRNSTGFEPMITTKRLEIIRWEIRHLEAFARSREELAKMLALRLPPSWPAFPEAYAPPETAAPDPRPWGSYFFLCPALGSLVGSGGFKGKPDSIWFWRISKVEHAKRLR